MNKIKELWKKQRLTSWHLYSMVLLFSLLELSYGMSTTGYTEYLENREAVTLVEFEGMLTLITIGAFLMVVDLVASMFLWLKEDDADSSK